MGGVTETDWRAGIDWLTLGEIGDLIGDSVSRVRRLIQEQSLLALRIDNVVRVPAAFVKDGRLLPSLRGTIIVLHDVGLNTEESIQWLFAPEETIGRAPIEALREGHKSEVRRVAQTIS